MSLHSSVLVPDARGVQHWLTAGALLEHPPEQDGVFGLTKVRPLLIGVSEKSMVTPSSSKRLSAGRNSFMPLASTTLSPDAARPRR